MEYYIGATLLSAVIAIIIKKLFGFEKHKVLKMFISLLPLTIVSALRYDVGWDYVNYAKAYSGYFEYGKLYFDEPGFKVFIQILAQFTEDPTILFASFSVLISLFFSLCFKAYGKSTHVLQYVLLFFMTRYFFCSLNIIRQALAMVMSLYAFSFIVSEDKKNKYLKFIIIILLAASIHKFALVFLPLSFVLKVDFSKILKYKKTLFVSIFVFIALALFLSFSGYLSYFETMFGNDGTMALSEFLICLAILLFGGLNYKKTVNSKQNLLFYNLEMTSLLVCLASPFIPTSDRIIWYFATLPSIFLIPDIIDSYGKQMQFIPMFVLYIFLAIVVYNQAVVTDSYNIIPYKNVIEVNESRNTI